MISIFIQNELNRRKPGQSKITTERKETDKVELLSGIFEGKSTGAPIGFVVRNEKQQPKDYKNISTLFRPSHADYTYYKEVWYTRTIEVEDELRHVLRFKSCGRRIG